MESCELHGRPDAPRARGKGVPALPPPNFARRVTRTLRRLLALASLLPLPAIASAADIPVITHGDDVRLENHLVPGKLVLFDFYADWCGPCRSLSPTIDRLADDNAGKLAVRKVDIVNWGSDVAKSYRIGSIPHLKLYGGDGTLLAEGGAQGVLEELEKRLGQPIAYGSPPRQAAGELPSGGGTAGPLLVVLLLFAAATAAALFLFRSRTEVARIGAMRTPDEAGAPNNFPHRAEEGGGPPSLAIPHPEPAAADRIWFVRVDVGIDGPYTPREIVALRRHGHLAAGAVVRRRNEREWTPLEVVFGKDVAGG
jgi:thiol-disulfide isomerase/thioredoxin